MDEIKTNNFDLGAEKLGGNEASSKAGICKLMRLANPPDKAVVISFLCLVPSPLIPFSDQKLIVTA